MIKILGIETSCDETAVAIVGSDKKIYAHQIFSQIADLKKYGGVVPEVAARSHMQYLDLLINDVMLESGLSFDDIDAIAVTAGPGLIGGVIVGVMYAKAIALATGKPLIAVNHLEGHALTVRLIEDVEFPFLLMLMSGGHTQILLVRGVGDYKILGSTRDDAAGECFDKVAKMLGLDFPGGPNLEKKAQGGDYNRFKFPKPLANEKSCDFSFSGLKTAVKRQIDELSQQGTLLEKDIIDICASLQHIVAGILVNRLQNALQSSECTAIKTLVVAGGVAANLCIRSNLSQEAGKAGLKFIAPPISLCGDNAAMIAWAGIERFQQGMIDDTSFAPRSRWSLED